MKLLQNVIIHKMDGAFSVADGMVWEDERIVAIGSVDELATRYPGAERVDGQGFTALPGFIDPHIHLLDGVIYQKSLDCSHEKARTISALKDLLRESASERAPGQWVVGQGYDPWEYPEKRTPTRKDLDEACPDHPVVVFHYSFHECAANSRALDLAGVNSRTPQPFAGEIVKDEDGEPTGHLIETAMAAVQPVSRDSLIQQSKGQILNQLALAQTDLFASGITRIGDPAVPYALEALYTEAFERDLLQIPIVLHYSSREHALLLPWDLIDDPRAAPEVPQMIAGPMKVFLDGADRAAMELSFGQFIQTSIATLFRCLAERSLDPLRTASRSPVEFTHGLRARFGTMMAGTDDCIRLVSQAAGQGMSPAFHALGNAAIRQAIEIVEGAQEALEGLHPARIEHGVFLDDELIMKMKKLGMILVTQPYFLTHMSRDNVPYLPGIRQLPLRSVLDAGIRVAGSSDWPVASHEPLEAIERAVSRKTAGEEVLQPEEAISVKEAFAMYTNGGAYALNCERDVGSLEAGKRADFVLLSNDPLGPKESSTNSPLWPVENSLNPPRVEQTWLGGKRVYCRSE